MPEASVFLLSDKSSGSTMLQAVFEEHPDVQVLPHTYRDERETLFWITSSAVLGREQVPFVQSSLPFTRAEGKNLLEHLIGKNLGAEKVTVAEESDVFRAWQAFQARFGPVLFEKTPHHLHQWSSLELMARCEQETGVPTYFIGLVRNPMDTLYSMWTRWRIRPEQSQVEWARAYSNLQRFGDLAGNRLLVVRYEDIVKQGHHLEKCFQFVGLHPPESSSLIHAQAIQKWRNDETFGFVLDASVARLARLYGYESASMANTPKRWWAIRREGLARLYELRRRMAHVRKGLSTCR